MAARPAFAMPHHRPDIDGLRGVAVLAVIVYHMVPARLRGGFVGVDIFFVLSGFLITGQLLASIRAGSFSLKEFYRRRIRRIAPVLLFVLAVTVVAAQWLLLPEDAQLTARAAVAAVAGAANIYFWLFQDTGYFAPDSRETPLLHVWSLGVEEQFYLLWPLLLCLLARHPALRVAAALLVGALLSFGLAEWLFDAAPRFVFYMLPTRAGELMAGAMLAVAGDGRIRCRPPCCRWPARSPFWPPARSARTRFRVSWRSRPCDGADCSHTRPTSGTGRSWRTCATAMGRWTPPPRGGPRRRFSRSRHSAGASSSSLPGAAMRRSASC
ncbi:MAG: acyltransferase [Rhodocyclaceae bacterium]|nr:acyltransferase [Rhodocyclaceae bacterium]